MRILVLGINYWPEETGIAPYNTWRCEYLASRGHEVTMCTTFPYYPMWRVADQYRGRVWQREERNGVTILRSWTWVPQRVNSLKRILHEASFLAFSLVRALSAQKPDVLLIESPPLGLALTAALLSRWWKVPFDYDVMDLQPDAAANLGMLPSGNLIRSLYWLERFAYRHATLVSTLNEGMRQRIISKSIPPEKVVLFAPRAEDDLFTIRASDAEAFLQAHELQQKFLVVHSGNMGVKQGLGVILDAAALSRQRPEIVYMLVGDGAAKPDLKAKAASLRLDNLRFLPLQDSAQFRSMLAAADVSLVTQQKSVSDIVFPSKTVTYLAAGCPVIASVSEGSEVARVVRDSGAGFVVAPEDPVQLVTAILRLQNRQAERTAMARAGREYAREHWDGARISSQMELELLKVVGKVQDATQPHSLPAKL